MADLNARLYARAWAPSGRGNASSTARTRPTDPCAPACVNCGSLECLCRPRFFAGQLLTEQDLNRLDAYIRAKNRLHTLQLHGWGVVNGLQVRCDPCGSGVVVGTGYGISPCGEDIIVCGDTTVDICALVKKCQPPDVTCQPMASGGSTCDDLEQDWVLTIRYSETPTRGVTALRMGGTCGCGATGGTCNTGCGSNPIPTTATSKPRGASPECEPTAICEGYSFDVFPAPESSTRDHPRQLQGPLIDSFLCCIQPLIDSLPNLPGPPTPVGFGDASLQTQWNQWCCRMRDALLRWFSSGPQPDCTLLARLSTFACPAPKSAGFAAAMQQAYQSLATMVVQAVLACLCASLLPPAPAGTSDDRVPLAVIRVRKKDCKVMQICNWTPLRRTVLTFPTLEYWFGWIPWLGSLRDILGRLCCAEPARAIIIGDRGGLAGAAATDTDTAAAAAELNPTLDLATAADNRTFLELAQSAFASPQQPVESAAFLDAVAGWNAPAEHPLKAVERENIAPFLLFNEVLRPIIASLTTSDTTGETPADTGGGGTRSRDDAASLDARIAQLEDAVRKLQGTP